MATEERADEPRHGIICIRSGMTRKMLHQNHLSSVFSGNLCEFPWVFCFRLQSATTSEHIINVDKIVLPAKRHMLEV